MSEASWIIDDLLSVAEGEEPPGYMIRLCNDEFCLNGRKSSELRLRDVWRFLKQLIRARGRREGECIVALYDKASAEEPYVVATSENPRRIMLVVEEAPLVAIVRRNKFEFVEGDEAEKLIEKIYAKCFRRAI